MDNTKRDKNIIDNYINDNLSLQKVGNKYGICRERVRQILNNYNKQTRQYTISNKYHKQNIEILINKYYKNDKTLLQTIKDYNYSITTFYKYIKLYHIKFKPKKVKYYIKYNDEIINNAINDRLNNKLSVNEIIDKYKLNKSIFFYYLRKYKKDK